MTFYLVSTLILYIYVVRYSPWFQCKCGLGHIIIFYNKENQLRAEFKVCCNENQIYFFMIFLQFILFIEQNCSVEYMELPFNLQDHCKKISAAKVQKIYYSCILFMYIIHTQSIQIKPNLLWLSLIQNCDHRILKNGSSNLTSFHYCIYFSYKIIIHHSIIQFRPCFFRAQFQKFILPLFIYFFAGRSPQ